MERDRALALDLRFAAVPVEGFPRIVEVAGRRSGWPGEVHEITPIVTRADQSVWYGRILELVETF